MISESEKLAENLREFYFSKMLSVKIIPKLKNMGAEILYIGITPTQL